MQLKSVQLKTDGNKVRRNLSHVSPVIKESVPLVVVFSHLQSLFFVKPHNVFYRKILVNRF